MIKRLMRWILFAAIFFLLGIWSTNFYPSLAPGVKYGADTGQHYALSGWQWIRAKWNGLKRGNSQDNSQSGIAGSGTNQESSSAGIAGNGGGDDGAGNALSAGQGNGNNTSQSAGSASHQADNQTGNQTGGQNAQNAMGNKSMNGQDDTGNSASNDANAQNQATSEISAQIEKARTAFSRGDIKTAISAYRAHLDENPDDVDALGELGNVYFLTQQFNEASQAYSKATDRLIEMGDFAHAQQLILVISRTHFDLADQLRGKLQSAQQKPAKDGG